MQWKSFILNIFQNSHSVPKWVCSRLNSFYSSRFKREKIRVSMRDLIVIITNNYLLYFRLQTAFDAVSERFNYRTVMSGLSLKLSLSRWTAPNMDVGGPGTFTLVAEKLSSLFVKCEFYSRSKQLNQQFPRFITIVVSMLRSSTSET